MKRSFMQYLTDRLRYEKNQAKIEADRLSKEKNQAKIEEAEPKKKLIKFKLEDLAGCMILVDEQAN